MPCLDHYVWKPGQGNRGLQVQALALWYELKATGHGPPEVRSCSAAGRWSGGYDLRRRDWGGWDDVHGLRGRIGCTSADPDCKVPYKWITFEGDRICEGGRQVLGPGCHLTCWVTRHSVCKAPIFRAVLGSRPFCHHQSLGDLDLDSATW